MAVDSTYPHAGDLSGKEKPRERPELQVRGQQGRGVQEGVPMDAPIADKFHVFQTGDHPEDPALFRPGQFRLKPHDVVEDSLPILPPELNDRMGLSARPRVNQTDRFHRAVGEGVDPPPGDHLDREASLEAPDLLEGAEGDLFRPGEFSPKGLVGFPVHRAVQVVRLAVPITGCREDPIPIDGFPLNDRGDRVVKVEVIPAGPCGNGAGKGVGGERAGCDDRDSFRGDFRDLAADQLQPGLCAEFFFNEDGEGVPVNGERLSGRDGRGVSRGKDQGIEAPHLLLQESNGVFQCARTERVAADELGEARGFVGRRKTFGFHLAKPHTIATTEELPGRLAAGKPPADDGDRDVLPCPIHNDLPAADQDGCAVSSPGDPFAGALYFMMLRHAG